MNSKCLRLPLIVLTSVLNCLWLGAQNVGIETDSPDSTLSINNKVEIGGAQGDIFFTDDLGSIMFPSTVAPNSPMIYLFSNGSSNADRMVLSHSPNFPAWGLKYMDTSDKFRFGVDGSPSGFEIDVGQGSIGVGTADASSQFTVHASSDNDVTTGYFSNTSVSNMRRTAIVGSATGNGTGDKVGGYFEVLLGGRNFAMQASASLGDTNVAVYASAGDFGTLPGAIDRAAWFDKGDVFIDEHLKIGSNGLNDNVDASALLELSSTTSGLLLPRMTAAQRLAISTPAEGLVVYDTDSLSVFIRSGGAWSPVSGNGGGAGGGFWSYNASPPGPYVSNDYVGVGTTPSFFRRMSVTSGTNLPYALEIVNNFDAGLGKYGLRIETTSAGTNNRYGIYNKTWAPNNSNTAYGIYTEANQYDSDATTYALYATAPGTGSGQRWAGWFEGAAMVTEDLTVDGDRVKLSPNGWLSGGRLMLTNDDGIATIDLHGNQNPSEGAELWMRNEQNEVTLQLDADYNDGSSYIRIREGANDRIRLNGKESAAEGPEILMYNASNVLSVEIDADVAGNGSGAIDVYDEDGTRTFMLRGAEAAGQGSSLKLYDAAGNQTIELDADFEGDGRIITQELQLNGGSDLAEYFSSANESYDIRPGQVVVIDSSNPGMVKVSQRSQDKKVIGVVSGANGIKTGLMMGQKESIAFGDIPVAIVGRVYVEVDESYDKIEPGDFLTTSDQKGKAMKVRDWEKARGAILGKALTYSDEGYVLVLVQMQ